MAVLLLQPLVLNQQLLQLPLQRLLREEAGRQGLNGLFQYHLGVVAGVRVEEGAVENLLEAVHELQTLRHCPHLLDHHAVVRVLADPSYARQLPHLADAQEHFLSYLKHPLLFGCLDRLKQFRMDIELQAPVGEAVRIVPGQLALDLLYQIFGG